MKTLIISAHMDDEVLGLGGTIARHVEAGDQVTVCIVCKRAYDHKFDPVLVEEQKTACRNAAGILGYRDIRFLDLRDELLDERLLDIIVPLEDTVQSVKPDVVYTNHRGDSNQDHRAVFQASMIACRALSSHKVSRLMAYEVPSSTDIAPPFAEYAFQPNYYVNIEPFLQKKILALNQYEREIKEFPHPRSVRGVEIYARKRGMEIGFASAEALMIIRDQWQ